MGAPDLSYASGAILSSHGSGIFCKKYKTILKLHYYNTSILKACEYAYTNKTI